MAFVRTAALLGLLTGILLAIGFFFAGIAGMTIALVIALMINLITYWFSDKIVLSIYRAKPSENKKLNAMIKKLAKEAEIPEPKVYTVPQKVPNAFATGRSPSHSAIAVTEGLLDLLDDDEIEAVVSHEMGHIKNRDTLISTLAATIAGAVSYLAQLAWWGMFSRDREGGNIILLPLIIFAPFASMLIRLAISRGREFQADYTGAMISNKPLALASALSKISNVAEKHPIRGNSATSHMWIVNPFSGSDFVKLFMTHPPVEERIERLKAFSRK